MLSEILSRQTCAACRLCCQFDASDIWELPVLPPETVQAIQKQKPETPFCSVEEEQTFAAPPLHGEELYACPMLTEHGCGLSETDKPFDCKIWPFRMMRDVHGTIGIAVSELCDGMKSYSKEQLRQFLQKQLAEEIFAYAAQHPAHIQPWREGYRMLLTQKATLE